MNKKNYVLGNISIIVYLFTIFLGEFLVSANYNPLIDVISAFPFYMSINKFVYVYISLIIANLFLFLFCFKAIKFLKKYNYQQFQFPFKLLSIQPIIYSIIYFFPMSNRGEPLTFSGLMHLLLFVTCITLTLVALLSLIKQCKKTNFFLFSNLYKCILLFMMIFTILTALSMLSILLYFGLYLRILLSGFLIFIFLLSIMMKRISV